MSTSDLPAAPTSNVATVYNRLREAILRNELPAGSRISQVQIAAEFEMSRGPLREALRLLEQEGLVRSEYNRMVRVTEVSFAEMADLYALRIINETFALSLVVPTLTPDDIAELRGLVQRMTALGEAEDLEAYRTEHRAFHLRLAAGAGPRMERLIAEMFVHAERYRRLYGSFERDAVVSTAVREHGEIVDACEAGDRVLASKLLARHLARTALTILAKVALEYEPARIREAVRFVDQQLDATPTA